MMEYELLPADEELLEALEHVDSEQARNTILAYIHNVSKKHEWKIIGKSFFSGAAVKACSKCGISREVEDGLNERKQ